MEIGYQRNILCQKTILSRDFAWASEIINDLKLSTIKKLILISLDKVHIFLAFPGISDLAIFP